MPQQQLPHSTSYDAVAYHATGNGFLPGLCPGCHQPVEDGPLPVPRPATSAMFGRTAQGNTMADTVAAAAAAEPIPVLPHVPPLPTLDEIGPLPHIVSAVAAAAATTSETTVTMDVEELAIVGDGGLPRSAISIAQPPRASEGVWYDNLDFESFRREIGFKVSLHGANLWAPSHQPLSAVLTNYQILEDFFKSPYTMRRLMVSLRRPVTSFAKRIPTASHMFH